MKANYTYLSDGTKAAAYTSASAGKDYVGSFVYARSTNGSKTLESVAFGGGRIRKNGSSYLVDYHVTDHMGSVRAIVTNGSIVEQDEKASSAFLQEVPVPYNLIDHQCANVVKGPTSFLPDRLFSNIQKQFPSGEKMNK